MGLNQDSTERSTSLAEVKKRRRRAHLACNTCRDRKTRCNGERPACSSCARRGVGKTCVYENSPLQRWRINPSLSGSTFAAPSKHSEQPHSAGVDDSHSTSTFEADTRVKDQQRARIYPVQLSNDSNVPIYAGSSSSVLLSQIKHALSRLDALPSSGVNTLNDGEAVGNRYGESPYANRMEILRDQDVTSVILPSREVANDLVECYFELSHPVFPVLHQPTFMASYEKMWTLGTIAEQRMNEQANIRQIIFNVTVNLVFAIGCQYTSLVSPAERSKYGNDFYQRSRKLVNFELLDGVQQSTVQILLLTAVYLFYLQPAKATDRGWNAVGLAIRAAQDAGLHLEGLTMQSTNQVDREMRRRIWHCATLMDRLLCMTYGRPMMVYRCDVPLPAIIDDEYMLEDGEGVQPPDIPSRMALFVHSATLFTVLEEVFTTFYHSQGGTVNHDSTDFESSEALSNVLRIEAMLKQWKDELPDFCKPGSPMSHPTEPWYDRMSLQSVILQNRYYNARILLFRPLLIDSMMRPFCAERESASRDLLRDSVISRACDLCLESAHALAENVFEHLDDRYRIHVWHGIYCAFVSALILVAAHICPSTPANLSDPLSGRTWERCIAILRHHHEQMPSSKRAVALLEALKAQVCVACDSTTTDPSHQQTSKQGGVDDLQSSWAPNVPGEHDGANSAMAFTQSHSNGINDIFENYDIWDPNTMGFDSFPLLGNWSLGVL